MVIFLTGASGYLGGAILRELLAHGHAVVAHARTAESAAALSEAGATSVVVAELADADWLGAQLAGVDGMVHAASPNDATSAALDNAVLDAALTAFASTGRPYVHTGGTWIHGSGIAITESSPVAAPPIVAWRPAVVDRVRAAATTGVRSCVIAPANLYGHGRGLPAGILAGPTTGDEPPALVFPGGPQHFPNAHVDDVAALYRLAIESAAPGSYYLAANADAPAMAEIAAAASRLRGLDGRAVGEDRQASRRRLGPLADALLLDARVDSARARHELGWNPDGPSLLDELTTGSYARTLQVSR
jgi:nucleoside-diphosphate-sugar epimerase